jgi:hypothetical protein
MRVVVALPLHSFCRHAGGGVLVVVKEKGETVSLVSVPDHSRAV